MAQRYFIQLSFKGTGFNGWQKQHNAPSVQAALETALGKLLRQNIDVTGAGRTDTGVHARAYFAHFDSEKVIDNITDFTNRLNMVAPYDIAIQKIWPVAEKAHARFDALSRTYEYQVICNKNPFEKEFCYYIKHPLNIIAMNEACKLLFEYSDFTSFCKLHSDNKTNLCKILEANWCADNEKLIFRIKADRFLRNMVRAIVGTMIEVGSGKLDIAGFRKVIEQKNRGKAGISVPAQGLYFVGADYPDSIMFGEK